MKDMTAYIQERFPLATVTRNTSNPKSRCTYRISYAWLEGTELVFFALCNDTCILEIQQVP